MRVDPRVGQLLQLVKTIEEDGIEAPRVDEHPHRFMAGELFLEIDNLITNGEEHKP